MSSSGPIIEELPDDYEKPVVAASASTSTRARQPADGGAAGLRKGFFSKPSARPAAEPCPVAPEPAAEAASATTAFGSDSSVAAAVGSGASVQGVEAVSRGSSDGLEAEIAGVLEALRARLASGGSSVPGGSGLSEGASEAVDELREAMASATAPSARWPTSQARSAMSKSSHEANNGLAEMRSASNDARRMRGGEEKKAMTDMRRVTDDVLDRVKKLVDLSAPRPVAEEERVPATVAAFHALPFTAKLRLIADDRVGLGLLTSSFAAGSMLVLGILLEVYSAWGCGYSCGQA